MAAPALSGLSQFAWDVAEGLATVPQKKIAPRYFYDDLGTALFDAITLLPEYGLTRADERLLESNASEIASAAQHVHVVAELGSGNGSKAKYILQAIAETRDGILYRPIDVSVRALATCERELQTIARVEPVCAEWLEGVAELARIRPREPMLLMFLGSSIGNLERKDIHAFLRQIRGYLRAGDLFLLGADLIKDLDRIMAAYDDPTGVTAAFNLNLLARMNRELDADFDLRSFAHEVRWNSKERRIEMHLLSCRNQAVYISALDASFEFRAGETIWTESSHKFTESELDAYAFASGFEPVATWVDREWPFAETLWRAAERQAHSPNRQI